MCVFACSSAKCVWEQTGCLWTWTLRGSAGRKTHLCVRSRLPTQLSAHALPRWVCGWFQMWWLVRWTQIVLQFCNAIKRFRAACTVMYCFACSHAVTPISHTEAPLKSSRSEFICDLCYETDKKSLVVDELCLQRDCEAGPKGCG